MANQFRLLLNQISSQLSENELRNLVHMWDIPEGLRSGMKDGISLFDNLIKRDIINDHKLDKLKMMFKSLSPKRRDIIKEIENFENGTYSQDDKSSTMTSAWSVKSTLTALAHPRSDIGKPTKICCKLDCPCLTIIFKKFRCKIPCSYIVLTTLFLLNLLIVTLFWYARVPQITEFIESHKHLKEAGPFILIGIIVVYVICLFPTRYWRKRRSRRSNQRAKLEDGMKEFRTKRSGKHPWNSAGSAKVENNCPSASTNFGFSIDENTSIVDFDTNTKNEDAVPRTS
ncbi:uncharacterized protein LOC114527234 [Dendronephthya gigantea]|uniref:uncharacterized protein LOC114527234 n=1 Tax=Dendronephthya gigantea TaxID=151771 RepID=UPI00106CA4A7|nr:uncharacterized protein LOC114527234 [Dendronephthya gigantea]